MNELMEGFTQNNYKTYILRIYETSTIYKQLCHLIVLSAAGNVEQRVTVILQTKLPSYNEYTLYCLFTDVSLCHHSKLPS